MDKKDIKDDLEYLKEEGAVEQKSPEESKGEHQTGKESEEPEAVAKLKEELEGARDKYIRLYTEFENFRKRTAKEKLELIQSGNEQLIKALLPLSSGDGAGT